MCKGPEVGRVFTCASSKESSAAEQRQERKDQEVAGARPKGCEGQGQGFRFCSKGGMWMAWELQRVTQVRARGAAGSPVSRAASLCR